MSVHRIRLRGPWTYEWLSPAKQESATGRVSLPLEWREVFGTEPGHVRFRRIFHRPTNLEPDTHLDVVFEGIGGIANITINGELLEQHFPEENSSASIRCRITEHLQPSNELQVDLQFDPQQNTQRGGLWGLVVLEILE